MQHTPNQGRKVPATSFARCPSIRAGLQPHRDWHLPVTVRLAPCSGGLGPRCREHADAGPDSVGCRPAAAIMPRRRAPAPAKKPASWQTTIGRPQCRSAATARGLGAEARGPAAGGPSRQLAFRVAPGGSFRPPSTADSPHFQVSAWCPGLCNLAGASAAAVAQAASYRHARRLGGTRPGTGPPEGFWSPAQASCLITWGETRPYPSDSWVCMLVGLVSGWSYCGGEVRATNPGPGLTDHYAAALAREEYRAVEGVTPAVLSRITARAWCVFRGPQKGGESTTESHTCRHRPRRCNESRPCAIAARYIPSVVSTRPE